MSSVGGNPSTSPLHAPPLIHRDQKANRIPSLSGRNAPFLQMVLLSKEARCCSLDGHRAAFTLLAMVHALAMRNASLGSRDEHAAE